MPGVFPGLRCAYPGYMTCIRGSFPRNAVPVPEAAQCACPGYMTCIWGSPDRCAAPPPGRGVNTNRKPRLTAPGENDEDIF